MENENTQKPQEVVSVPAKQSSSNNSKYFLIAVLVIVIIILIGAVGYLLGQKNNQQNPISQNKTQTLTPTQTLSPTSTPTPTLGAVTIENTGVANQKRYTNPQVGISFIFPAQFAGDTFDVKEVGDKIYVYDTKYPYTQAQYIEVFLKNPADTLEQAIQKQFLTNISPKDCFVKDSKPDQGANFPPNFEVKTLGYPVDPNSDLPPFAQPNKCPATYAETNGMQYFLGDTKHPKIFLFFSIGQQAFPIAENSQITWQDTIEFLN